MDIPLNPDGTKRCPTCQGIYWSVKHGKWIHTRETVDMVCQTCGRDYMQIDEDEEDRRKHQGESLE